MKCLVCFLSGLDLSCLDRLAVVVMGGVDRYSMWREPARHGYLCILRNLPQINKRIGLLVAQEAINIHHQRLRRVDMHIIAVLRTLQVQIWIYKRFWPNVRFRLDVILLFARCERSAEAGSAEEDV